jgi:hypothetical protein
MLATAIANAMATAADSAAWQEASATSPEGLFSACPGCGAFLLNAHASYRADAQAGGVGLGEIFSRNGTVGMRLGRCPMGGCGALICQACRTLVEPHEASTHMCKQGGATIDAATKALMTKVCKPCPGCGTYLQKNEHGCALMMCGTVAHGAVRDALRNGGCAYLFHWETGEAIIDDHGYVGLDGRTCVGAGVVTDRQVLKRYAPAEAELQRAREAGGRTTVEILTSDLTIDRAAAGPP